MDNEKKSFMRYFFVFLLYFILYIKKKLYILFYILLAGLLHKHEYVVKLINAINLANYSNESYQKQELFY